MDAALHRRDPLGGTRFSLEPGGPAARSGKEHKRFPPAAYQPCWTESRTRHHVLISCRARNDAFSNRVDLAGTGVPAQFRAAGARARIGGRRLRRPAPRWVDGRASEALAPDITRPAAASP